MPCIRLAKPPRLHATEECARRLETAAPAQSKAPESLPSACSNGVDRAHRGGGRIRPRVRSRHHGALSPETQVPGRSSVQRQKRPPRQRRPEAERAVGWSFLLEVERNRFAVAVAGPAVHGWQRTHWPRMRLSLWALPTPARERGPLDPRDRPRGRRGAQKGGAGQSCAMHASFGANAN
jgi:hypothetical protein